MQARQSVNCRIGSLEMRHTACEDIVYVNCRIGSLETGFPVIF